MAEITETQLPGVGVRREFLTERGARVGVVRYRDGRRELVLFDETDPDECRASVTLSDDDASALADLLGGSAIIEQAEHRSNPG
jgi:TrkA domain protein